MIKMTTLQGKALAFLRSGKHGLEPEQVARFTGAKSLDTVQDWISGKQPPRGLRLNRLWWLMSVMGVATPELDEVSDFGHYLGELLAFDVIDLNKARAYCGTKQEQAVFDVIRGNRNVVNATATYEELKSEHDDALQAKRAQKLAHILPDVETLAGTSTVYPAELARTHLLITMARELGGIQPLVNYLLSDKCTAADRAMVRGFLGDSAVFDLANGLNRLCSERANTQGK